MLFLGWIICYASNVFILVSGSVGFFPALLCAAPFTILTILITCILVMRKIEFTT